MISGFQPTPIYVIKMDDYVKRIRWTIGGLEDLRPPLTPSTVFQAREGELSRIPFADDDYKALCS